MELWVMTGTYNGEHFATTHLTEVGALKSMIFDVLQFLGIEEEEHARAVPDAAEKPDLEWSPQVIGEMEVDELRSLMRKYHQYTWDNCEGYSIEICRCQLEA